MQRHNMLNFQRLHVNTFKRANDMSDRMSVGEVITTMREISGVVAVRAVAKWQGVSDKHVPEGDPVLKENDGLHFLDVWYATDNDQPVQVCGHCGTLKVGGKLCQLCSKP